MISCPWLLHALGATKHQGFVMWNRLRHWLHAIPIRDLLTRRQALLVQNILIALIAIILVSLPLALLSLDVHQSAFLTTLTLLLVICYIVFVLIILRRGHFNSAIMLTTLSLILVL